jgi:hypothetical protein
MMSTLDMAALVQKFLFRCGVWGLERMNAAQSSTSSQRITFVLIKLALYIVLSRLRWQTFYGNTHQLVSKGHFRYPRLSITRTDPRRTAQRRGVLLPI